MLKEHILILTKSEACYGNFINLIKRHFSESSVFYNSRSLLEYVDRLLSSGTAARGSLPVIFIEQQFLECILENFRKRASSSDYILICFNNMNSLNKIDTENIFDYIVPESGLFSEALFFKRLSNEIESRNKIAFLQSEVSEFYEIGKSLSSEKDTLQLFEKIINTSISLTSSDAGTIFLVVDSKSGSWSSVKNNNYEDKLLKFAIAKNMSMDVNLEATTSAITKESIFGCTIISGRALRIDNAYNIDPSKEYIHNHSVDVNTGYVTKSIMSIPMKDHENNVMGVIQLINKKKSGSEKLDFGQPDLLERSIIPYDYKDELIMNSLAAQAAIALENNLLYREMYDLLKVYKEQNRELEILTLKTLKAHEEERKRIAREIHDGPAQSVVNLSLKLELCKKLFQMGRFDSLSTSMDELNSGIRFAVKEIRSIIYDLKPSYLEDGIIKALENHFNIFSEGTGINVSFNCTTDGSNMEYYLTSTLYRIVQELFSNIHKHAEAKHIEVNLHIGSKSIMLKIIDDGKGFDIRILQKNLRRLEGGFGIEGIRERVELIKGNIDIESAVGKGTTVTVEIPLMGSEDIQS